MSNGNYVRYKCFPKFVDIWDNSKNFLNPFWRHIDLIYANEKSCAIRCEVHAKENLPTQLDWERSKGLLQYVLHCLANSYLAVPALLSSSRKRWVWHEGRGRVWIHISCSHLSIKGVIVNAFSRLFTSVWITYSMYSWYLESVVWVLCIILKGLDKGIWKWTSHESQVCCVFFVTRKIESFQGWGIA